MLILNLSKQDHRIMTFFESFNFSKYVFFLNIDKIKFGYPKKSIQEVLIICTNRN